MGDRRFFTFKKPQVFIKVWVAKTRKFKISVDDKKHLRFEITVGGGAWNEGKGREFEEVVKKRCKNIPDELIEEYGRAFNETYQFQGERVSSRRHAG